MARTLPGSVSLFCKSLLDVSGDVGLVCRAVVAAATRTPPTWRGTARSTGTTQRPASARTTPGPAGPSTTMQRAEAFPHWGWIDRSCLVDGVARQFPEGSRTSATVPTRTPARSARHRRSMATTRSGPSTSARRTTADARDHPPGHRRHAAQRPEEIRHRQPRRRLGAPHQPRPLADPGWGRVQPRPVGAGLLPQRRPLALRAGQAPARLHRPTVPPAPAPSPIREGRRRRAGPRRRTGPAWTRAAGTRRCAARGGR